MKSEFGMRKVEKRIRKLENAEGERQKVIGERRRAPKPWMIELIG